MFKPRLFLMTALISFGAFAEVSIEEKQNRVEYLEGLASQAVSMNIDGYRRELEYEKQNLPLDKRAENEANLLAEQIKVQVQRAYEAALTTKSAEEAAAEVRDAIEKDHALLSPELRNEVKDIAISTLENVQNGIYSSELDLNNIEKVMLKNVTERSQYLNEEGEEISVHSANPDPSLIGLRNEDSKRLEYATKQEIVDSLVSDRESVRWVATSNMSVKSDTVTRTEKKINLMVKAEFLGVTVEAGPQFIFTRKYGTYFTMSAESLNPILLPDGNLDFYKRDENGKHILKNGKPIRRFVNLTCEATLLFESENIIHGGVFVSGIGGGANAAKVYTNYVNMSSRRILVPDYIDGKTVTIKLLNELCHNEFLKGKITNTMTVEDSLNVMMKNVISNLRYSHPKTKCSQDYHCNNWFKNEVIALARLANYPRCVEEKREKYFACELRGLQGQNCAVFDTAGKKVSDGMFEFSCDVGLKCVKVQDAGWFKGGSLHQAAKGRCMPINAATYKAPGQKNYIDVQLIRR